MKKEERLQKLKREFMDIIKDPETEISLTGYMDIASSLMSKYKRGHKNERMLAAILANSIVSSNGYISMNCNSAILKSYDDYKNYYNCSGEITAVASIFVEVDTETTYVIDCIYGGAVDISYIFAKVKCYHMEDNKLYYIE